MTPITLLGDTPTNAGEPPETFLGSFSDTKEIFSITTSDVDDCSLCAHVLDLEVMGGLFSFHLLFRLAVFLTDPGPS